ncbi:PTS transporter subunit EIIC [Cryobacterium sp. SO2]|uniref:PTS sugar transporter subunit IIC n=1 Tax=Cryobacterium sp. SO2 TaxID=1897060 RepID=UPI00223D3560|nr:PTS transporter subunit EIIC [Cryobacterium sp. SO2]WEO78721.1 PTS transporter subunit EIIC [Cryobacterium sp. SO2]
MKADSVVDRFQLVTSKIQENRYVKAISNGFMSTLPVLMFGAICALVVGFPIPGWSDWVRATPFGAALQLGNDVTIGLLALYVVVSISYRLAREFDKDALGAVVIALLAFALVLPMYTDFTPEGGDPITVTGVIPVQWLGSQGVFSALIVALVSTRIYVFVIDRGWKISMPASVPPAVSRPFEAIIPAAIIGMLFLVVHQIFAMTPFKHMGAFIFTSIGEPIAAMGDSYWTWLVIVLLSQILWVFGIHNSAVWGLVFPIMLPAAFANQDAGAAGQALPYVVTITLVFAIYQWIGGSGNTLGLATNMLLFAKSKRYKTLGRLAGPPSIFNINEPLMFGFPIVYNPLMAIPFILTPVINITVGYFLVVAGIVGNPYIALPVSAFTMPLIPGGFVIGGGVTFGIFLICCYLFSVVAYFPFFRIADRRELLEERAAERELELAESEKSASEA